ncbi:methylated-DNA--[protein]-cysteine S-methyltransferase [Pseudoroseicyclus sp. CXY001]|uniref:methylated-DNA--[protein]-cysteine S-methyltransferase n=1 Tax=Pseudoroseicyclus sp. CXY001 TaxID=3242492 RepID=UPI00357124FF
MSGVRAGAETAIGPFWVEEAEGRLTAAGWGVAPPPKGGLAAEALAQLAAYLAGTRREFDLPLDLGPKARNLQALADIPYGETITYGDLAARLGISAQGAGQVCGSNHLPIFVPCHRVLGAGSLGGYSGAGGIETKVWLLRLEGAAGLLI